MPIRTEPTDFVAGMVVRSPQVRNNNPLFIDTVTPTYVLFDGIEEHACGSFPRRRYTLEQFEVLAHERLTGPTMHEWLLKLREIGRPVEPADLQPDLTYYGIRTSSEVQAWWVAQLNDPSVEVGLLGQYLDRLANPFFWPPSMMTRFVDWFGAMERNKQLELMSGESPTKWRRTLLAIGEVLLNPQRYDAGIVAAATVALQDLRPVPTPN